MIGLCLTQHTFAFVLGDIRSTAYLRTVFIHIVLEHLSRSYGLSAPVLITIFFGYIWSQYRRAKREKGVGDSPYQY